MHKRLEVLLFEVSAWLGHRGGMLSQVLCSSLCSEVSEMGYWVRRIYVRRLIKVSLAAPILSTGLLEAVWECENFSSHNSSKLPPSNAKTHLTETWDEFKEGMNFKRYNPLHSLQNKERKERS